METDLQGHTKSLAQDTGSLGQGKGSHGMLSQQKKERAQFTIGPAKVRRDMLGWKDSTVQEISHELRRQIPDHRGEPDPQSKEIPEWLGN